jgi:hypothetical protein
LPFSEEGEEFFKDESEILIHSQEVSSGIFLSLTFDKPLKR